MTGAALFGVAALVALGVVVVHTLHPGSSTAIPTPPPRSTCTVASAAGRVVLDPDQAANATTIAAVGKRAGLADHAVTVALVAALQESRLRNLTYGDLDSLGLFQQRPSQGWGTPAELLVPSYAAAAFYEALVKVPAWETMAVGDAAQAVQRSAAPDAYARWEHSARVMADALTGESAAAFACHFVTPVPLTDPGSLDTAIADELGAPALGDPLVPARGWTVASWLVAHAPMYQITSVSFMGELWTPSTGEWQPDVPVTPYVEIARI